MVRCGVANGEVVDEVTGALGRQLRSVVTTVLDGGLATELEARGHDLSDRLWSARVLLTEPDAIEDVHLAYFRAGARVATTASYQATIPGFAAAGLDRDAALGAIARSVELARRARDRYAEEAGLAPSELLVAGSVGPYGAMLADGSEYRGDYDPGEAVLRELHAPRIEALLEAGVDVLALETIPTMREASVLLDLVAEAGARAWLSYQCRDEGTTAAGEPFERGGRPGRRPGWDRRGRRQLHGPATRTRPDRSGRGRHGPAVDRLSQWRRPLGRRGPALDRRRRNRQLRAGRGGRLDSPWRHLARRLLRHRPERHPGARRGARLTGRMTAQT